MAAAAAAATRVRKFNPSTLYQCSACALMQTYIVRYGLSWPTRSTTPHGVCAGRRTPQRPDRTHAVTQATRCAETLRRSRLTFRVGLFVVCPSQPTEIHTVHIIITIIIIIILCVCVCVRARADTTVTGPNWVKHRKTRLSAAGNAHFLFSN